MTEPSTRPPEPGRHEAGPSRSPITAWAMLAVSVPLGGWLLREIHRTIGLDAPTSGSS